jgi:hypothetical protein
MAEYWVNLMNLVGRSHGFLPAPTTAISVEDYLALLRTTISNTPSFTDQQQEAKSLYSAQDRSKQILTQHRQQAEQAILPLTKGL